MLFRSQLNLVLEVNTCVGTSRHHARVPAYVNTACNAGIGLGLPIKIQALAHCLTARLAVEVLVNGKHPIFLFFPNDVLLGRKQDTSLSEGPADPHLASH